MCKVCHLNKYSLAICLYYGFAKVNQQLMTRSYISNVNHRRSLICVTLKMLCTRLFYSNEQFANFNHEQLRKLDHPVAHTDACHSSALARNVRVYHMWGFIEPVVFLAKGARFMLTMNLWSSVGICNGATGPVVDIIYQNNHQPPDLLIPVIVEFENYRDLFLMKLPTIVYPDMLNQCHITERNRFPWEATVTS